MDNLITVVSLQGQAWAVAQDGSRRELQVGDTLAATEMVVTADGAQIDLQFANNQVLSLIGEQEMPAQALQDAQATPLSTPLTPINTPVTTSTPASQGSHALKEGHNFVQLVRIAEIIEADGFTPLTVARIAEIIKPLGMVLPERDFEDDRWKDNYSRNEHGSHREYSVSIAIDVIADDDIINAAEAKRDITVTGTVSGDVKPGDKVTVTVNGKTYETTVNPDGKTWNVDIPGRELVQDKTVEATVTSNTPTGEPITADTERPYDIDTELPSAKPLPPQSDEDADLIDLDLREHFTDNKTPVDELDIVVEGLPKGLTYDKNTGKITGVIDKSASQGGPDKDGKYTVTVTVTDPAGNSSEHDFVWTVTNPPPVAKDDTGETDEYTPLVVDAKDGVLKNDNDLDGDQLYVTGIVAGETKPAAPGGLNTEIKGKYGTLTLQEDGSYVYTPDKSKPVVRALEDGETLEDTFSYTMTDREGGEDDAVLRITINGVSDPGLVIEDKNGAEVGANSIAEDATSPVTGTFKVTAYDGIKEISVGGVTVTAAQLADLAANPVAIPGTEGTLTLTGFDPITGAVTYSYQQTGTNKDHSFGKDKVTDSFGVIVTDSGGASTTPQDLVILITDTAPVAKPDTNEVTEDSGVAATGNVITGTGADDVGADAVTVTGVVKGTVAADPKTEVTGSVGGTGIDGEYGALVLDSNGDYTYTLNDSDPRVNALQDKETLTDTFSYTIKDADGDWSTTTVTITINGRTDGNPTIVPEDKNGADPSDLLTAGQVTVYESGLTTDDPSGQSKTAGGEITVQALDGLVSVSVAGQTFDLDALASLSPTNVAINTEYGILTLNGFTPVLVDGIIVGGELTYSYELTKPFNNTEPGEEGDQNGLDTLDLKVVDAGNAESAGSLIINIIDDAPSIGTPEDNTVHESGLPGGSGKSPTDVTVTGNLDVRVGADSTSGSPAKVSFAEEQAALKALNLSSGYDASNQPVSVEYVVTDSVVTAYKGTGRGEADKVFTVTITNPGSNAAGYEFTLHKPLNHGTETKLDLPFYFAVIDGDNDPANKTFTITVTDDVPTESSGEYILDIVEDSITTTSENSFNTSADANPSNTVISVTGVVDLDVVDDGKGGKTYTYPATHTGSQDFYGSVTVNSNGSITYVPNPNYSNPGSTDIFTYTTTNGPDIDTIKVIVNVAPVADAPDLEANKVLVTPEDTARSLELKTPVVTDKIQVPGASATTDYPERLGEITLTLTGTAIGTLTNADGSTTYKNTGVDGIYKFVITGVADLHLNGLTTAGDATVNYVTQAEYEAIKALPAEDRHENFDVKVSVDSYEVDVSGTPQGGIASANNTQTITVDVHAVTDDVGLKVKEGDAQDDVTVVISNADKTADITFNEDTSFNLTNILNPAAFKDLDGSETRYLTVEGLPVGTVITVGTDEYTVNATDVPMLTLPGAQETLPVITITPPKDFSGDLKDIKVTLGALDSDADSKDNADFVVPVLKTDSVTINLRVKPVAGDVAAGNVETNEDTAVAFLAKVRVTDTGTTHGTEVINSVAFEIPTGWTLTAPAAGSGWNVSGTGTAADKYTITFDACMLVSNDYSLR